MNEVKTIKRTGTISKIESTAPRTINGVTRPGNPRINNDWYSGIELRNCLIAAGFNPNIPISALRGMRMNWEELVVTQEILDQNGGEYKHTIRGREVSYKKPGKNNINLYIEFPVLEGGLMGLADLSVKYQGLQRTPLTSPNPVSTPTPGTTEELEEIMESDDEHVDLNATGGPKPEEVVETRATVE